MFNHVAGRQAQAAGGSDGVTTDAAPALKCPER